MISRDVHGPVSNMGNNNSGMIAETVNIGNLVPSNKSQYNIQKAIFNFQEKVNQRQPLVDGHSSNGAKPSNLLHRDDKIADWLSSIDFHSIQKDTLSKHTTGTGTWFLGHVDFRRWLNGHSAQILWVKGMFGAGKTILSSIVINHLETTLPNAEGDTTIIFAYCRHSDRHSSTDILASFVKQLAQRHSAVLSLVKSVYTNPQDGISPRHTELLDILRKSISLFKQVYIIVDALDELPEDNFLWELESLRARLLVTSRPSFTSHLLRLALSIEIGDKNQRDIELFINQRIKESTDLTDLLGQDAQIQRQIYAELKETSKGMFLIVPLQIKSLKNCTTVNELRFATEPLSSDINDTYSPTWKRIKAQPEKGLSLARSVITWLVYAYRPLKISELQHALAVRLEKEHFDNDDVATAQKILSVCSGLIVVDEESQSVRFVHSTALTYFKNLGRSLYPTPHTLITECCLWYLSESKFQFTKQKIKSHEDLRKYLNEKERPLRDYAYSYWGRHARCCHNEEVGQRRLPPTVSDLLGKCGQYPCVVNGTDFDLFERSHIVAYYGLQDSSLNAESNQRTAVIGFTPLILACIRGNEENVETLLIHGKASVNTRANNGLTPLYAASCNGHEGVVYLLLLCNEVAVNTQRKDGWRVSSALHKFVFQDKVDVNKRAKDGYTPLFAASSVGHEAVVRLLLSHKDIDVNKQTKDGRTPLFAASSEGHKGVVNLLLTRKNIAVNVRSEYGWTALLAASRNGHEAIVDVLLTRPDIAVNTQTEEGWTALIAASSEGHEAVVKLLLSHRDVDRYIQKEGQTALAVALHNDHKAVIRLLTGA